MKSYILCVRDALKKVFVKKRYWVITVLVALLMYALNPLLLNYSLWLATPSLGVIWALIAGWPQTVLVYQVLTMILIALLAGMVVSLSVFQLKKQLALGIGSGIGGTLVGLLAPSCPACAVGLLGLLGLGAFLSVLPFKGAELGLIGILILLASLVYLSKKIITESCSLPRKN